MSLFYKISNRIGDNIFRFIYILFEISLLGYDTVTSLFSRRGRAHISMDQFIGQVLFTGADSFGIVAIIALSSGLIISLQTILNMPEIGVMEYFGEIMVIAIIRELGPLITSLVVIGRSGSALAAYIGNMRVTKEISAIEVMGINPIHFIALPTLLGMIFSMIALNVYFDFFAIAGGLLLVSFIIDENFFILIKEVLHSLTISDIIISLAKGLVFSTVTAIVSIYYGLSVKNIRMVPRAVFHAVVISLMVTILLNVLLTMTYYAIRY